MKLLVLSMCSKEKAGHSSDQLTIDDFRRGQDHVASREYGMKHLMMPAAEFYLGAQHRRLMNGINKIGEAKRPDIALDHRILSAGYGIIRADRPVAPYDCTFNGMKKRELHDWAEKIRVPGDARALLEGSYDLALILLTREYLEACCLDQDLRFGGKVLFLCSARCARKLPATDTVRSFALTNSEASRFQCWLISLKGELASRILSHIPNNPGLVGEFPTSDAWARFFASGRFPG